MAPARWSEAEIDGFTLAAIACEDPGAGLAGRGLASDVQARVTERARSLQAAPAQLRRDWVRRLLTAGARTGAR